MGETGKEIKNALPDIESEEVTAYANELDRILAIKRLFDSEGGKELLSVLKGNCAIALRKAVLSAQKGGDSNPFLLDYAANLSLLSTVQDISMEKEIRKQLDEAVKTASRN